MSFIEVRERAARIPSGLSAIKRRSLPELGKGSMDGKSGVPARIALSGTDVEDIMLDDRIRTTCSETASSCELFVCTWGGAEQEKELTFSAWRREECARGSCDCTSEGASEHAVEG